VLEVVGVGESAELAVAAGGYNVVMVLHGGKPTSIMIFSWAF
jgi:hypothetical protein